MTNLSKLFLDFHGPDQDAESGDWHAILNGSWACPEGTRGEWLYVVNAIETGATEAFGKNGRLGMIREEDGTVRIFSPRNEVSLTGGLHVAKADVARLCDAIRRELGGEVVKL